MSYLVEQPPHCDLLRLSLSTSRFVRFGRAFPWPAKERLASRPTNTRARKTTGRASERARERSVGRFSSSSPRYLHPAPRRREEGFCPWEAGVRTWSFFRPVLDLVVFPTSVGLSRFSDHLHMRSLAPVRRCEAFFLVQFFGEGLSWKLCSLAWM